MLMKAIECRVRERELFQSMRCRVCCDMRIIGRDRSNRPVIYMSARSQKEHLRELIPQVFLAFEAVSSCFILFHLLLQRFGPVSGQTSLLLGGFLFTRET